MDILVVVWRVGSLETTDELTKEELENVLNTKGGLVVSVMLRRNGSGASRGVLRRYRARRVRIC